MYVSHIGPPRLFRFRINFWNYDSTCTFHNTPWTADRPIGLTQDSTTQKDTDIHPCLEWDSNPQSQCSRDTGRVF